MPRRKLRADHWALKDPIESRRSDESKREFESRVLESLNLRLGLLIDQYQIDRNDPEAGWQMALLLAGEVYPGFRIKQGGRGPTFNTADDLIVWASVDLAKQRNSKVNIDEVIRGVARANGWPDSDSRIRTLVRRYHAAKNPGEDGHAKIREFLRWATPHLTAALARSKKRKVRS